jgi:hypothetical protein
VSPWMLEARQTVRAWWPLKLPATRAPVHTLFVAPGQAWHLMDGHVVDGHPGAPHAAAPFEQGADWCRAHAGQSLRVVVSGHLMHHLCVGNPALPLHSEEDVATWARHQWLHYHGAVAQQWPLAVWCEGDERGASALHGLDLPALQQAAQAHQVSLRAVDPWWSVALRAVAAQRPAWGQTGRATLWLVEGALCTVVQVAAGRVQGLGTRWLEEASPAGLTRLLMGEPGGASDGASDGETLLPGDLVLGYGLVGDETLPPPLRAAALGRLDGQYPALLELA